MGTRDRWIFLILFTGFSTVLFLATVLIAQLETYVPGRKARNQLRTPDEEETRQHHRDEPTAA
jgi:hypothetical protein